RMASVVSSTLPARRRLIRVVRPTNSLTRGYARTHPEIMTGATIQISQHSGSPQSLFALVAGIIVVVVALILRSFPSQRHRPMISDRDHRLDVDSSTVTHHSPDRPPRVLILDTLSRVAVETNDLGPFENDVFIILEGRSPDASDCRLLIPQDSSGTEPLLRYLFALPGFDADLWTSAMASTSGHVYEVWTSLPSPRHTPISNPA
ncbi:MAG: hypothetical protein ACOYOF_14225, partial [Verrucomicrobiaceae bacterium]